MLTTCAVLPHETADGPANMALDEAMLDHAAADPASAWLRTYEWSVPTLSLGYFQRWADAEADPRWRDVPIVRRPTGGGALWHDREVTYAVVVPGDHPLARPSTALYRAVHEAISGLLRERGLPAGRPGAGEIPPAERAGPPFLCFTGRDPEDIVAHGVKVVGSAQRRRSGAVLQHGSLLLARSPRTPELPGVGDLAPDLTDRRSWADLLRLRLPEALGLRAVAREAPATIRDRARALEQTLYREPGWNRRR